jgi:protein-L-isoaspartate(D-aspartate) O-methyltransferase
VGGKLLIPVGDEKQVMTLFIRKTSKEFEKHELGDFAFVPMLQKKA